MPLYDYQCAQCGRITEVRHGFDESYAERCAHCGGELRRVFNPAPILFKGSGFYVTDSRGKSGGGDKPAPEKPTGDKPPESKGDSVKPAEKKSGESAA